VISASLGSAPMVPENDRLTCRRVRWPKRLDSGKTWSGRPAPGAGRRWRLGSPWDIRDRRNRDISTGGDNQPKAGDRQLSEIFRILVNGLKIPGPAVGLPSLERRFNAPLGYSPRGSL